MSRVIYLDEASYNGGVAGGSIALECLSLEKLPNLLRLSRDDNENMFQNLSKLRISECPKLSGLPWLPSLSFMGIKGKGNQDLLRSFHKFGSLKSLDFVDDKELTCFPDEMLRNLTSLKKLLIKRCSQIEGLGKALQHATSLESLSLRDLPNLASLPDSLGNLCSLHILEISNCPKVMCLPTSIQSLTGLKSLKINCCSELGKRCEKETGEDWHKISHIQNISIEEIRF